MSEIFRHLVPPTGLRASPNSAPLILLRISKRWQEIAIGTPRLWNSLTLESPVPSVSAWDVCVGAMKWFSRAGNLPRLLSVTLGMDFDDIIVLRILTDPRNIRVQGLSLFTPSYFLRMVMTKPIMKDFPWAVMTTLDLDGRALAFSEMQTLIIQCTGLTSCNLHLFVGPVLPAVADSRLTNKPTTLHCLKTLKISCYYMRFPADEGLVSRFMLPFSFPGLEKLEIKAGREMASLVAAEWLIALQTRSSSPLAELRICGFKFQTHALRSFFQGMPTIKDLHLETIIRPGTRQGDPLRPVIRLLGYKSPSLQCDQVLPDLRNLTVAYQFPESFWKNDIAVVRTPHLEQTFWDTDLRNMLDSRSSGCSGDEATKSGEAQEGLARRGMLKTAKMLWRNPDGDICWNLI